MCNFSEFIEDFVIIFLQDRFYPDVMYEKISRKNMFLTDKIARTEQNFNF